MVPPGSVVPPTDDTRVSVRRKVGILRRSRRTIGRTGGGGDAKIARVGETVGRSRTIWSASSAISGLHTSLIPLRTLALRVARERGAAGGQRRRGDRSGGFFRGANETFGDRETTFSGAGAHLQPPLVAVDLGLIRAALLVFAGVLLLMVPRVRSRRRRSKCCARAARGTFFCRHTKSSAADAHVSWNRHLVREPPEIPSDAGRTSVAVQLAPHSASRGAMALCARSPFEAIGRTVYRWPLLVYFASLLVPVALTVAVVRAPARNRVPLPRRTRRALRILGTRAPSPPSRSPSRHHLPRLV